MINIFIIDDHDLVRTGIRKILSENSGLKVVGEARTGEEGVKLVKELNPDIVLMDIKMPGIGGLEATRKILRHSPDCKVIAISVFDSDIFPMRFLQAGALGYLTKGASSEEMLQAIRSVYAGQRYVSPEIANQIALRRLSDNGKNPFDELSERELQVTMMITRGIKPQEISKKLHLSAKTVNSYRYRIFEKLNVKNDVELTHLAIQYQLTDAETVADEE